MSNSSTVYWDIDGTSIQTFAYNVKTLGGRGGVPAFRGENVAVAYRPGLWHRAKVIEPTPITLAMWVQGADTDGKPTSRGQKLEFEKNWRALRRLFWKDGSQPLTLTKRWKDPDSLQVLTASAQVENVSTMDVTMQGEAHAVFAVDLLPLDGLFFAPVVTTVIGVGLTVAVVNPGDAGTFKIDVEFDGDLGNPTLTNLSTTPVHWVKVGTTVAVGDTVTLDVYDMQATRQSDSANMIGAVSRSGARQWFTLNRGTNQVKLEADSGTGSATLLWQPAYF